MARLLTLFAPARHPQRPAQQPYSAPYEDIVTSIERRQERIEAVLRVLNSQADALDPPHEGNPREH